MLRKSFRDLGSLSLWPHNPLRLLRPPVGTLYPGSKLGKSVEDHIRRGIWNTPEDGLQRLWQPFAHKT